MSQAIEKSQGLYLEDLRVSQRFVSGTHHMDEQRSRSLPESLIRSLFIWMKPRQKSVSSADWPPADGIRRPLPCAFLWMVVCLWAMALSAWAVIWRGPSRHGL